MAGGDCRLEAAEEARTSFPLVLDDGQVTSVVVHLFYERRTVST